MSLDQRTLCQISAWTYKAVVLVITLIIGTIADRGSMVLGAPTQGQPLRHIALNEENKGDRVGAFQILADGSQDLAALVGLFATDGVERYTIDYTRGLVPPATAPLSLLGLLGYVRALLKLSLGVEFCERIGFSIASFRSFAGVRRADFSQRETAVDVNYLERSVRGASIQWRLVKTVVHTQESMPMTAGGGVPISRDRRTHDASYGIAICRLPQHRGTLSLTFGLYLVSLAFAVSISSFPVLMFTSKWTWTRIFASAGLPMSILSGSLPWCLVYITEHLPFEPCDWFRSDWKNGLSPMTGSPDEPGQSLFRKNSFAYFAKEDHFYIFDCRAAAASWIWLARLASCCSAVCITVAYLCQYIELRSASAKASGIWLGLQGILAIVRILAWDWAPNLLGFSKDLEIRWTDQRDNLLKNSLTGLEITLCRVSIPEHPSSAPHLPIWLVKDIDSMKLVEAFAMACRFWADDLRSGDFRILKDAGQYWDMPDAIFARWLQLRCRSYGHDFRHVASKRRMGIATWMCRIIQDSERRLHMIPGISVRVYFIDRTLPPPEVIFFSHFRDRETNIFSYPSNYPNMAQALYCGLKDIPDDRQEVVRVAKHSLEAIYQQVVDELWNEMLLALRALGFAETHDS